MAMQFDHAQLRDLLDQLCRSDIQEFRLEGEDFRLEVRRNLPVNVVTAPAVSVAPGPAPAGPAVPAPAPPPPAAAASRSDLQPITEIGRAHV